MSNPYPPPGQYPQPGHYNGIPLGPKPSPTGTGYASWGVRVGAALLDALPVLMVLLATVPYGLYQALRDTRIDAASGLLVGEVHVGGILIVLAGLALGLVVDVVNRVVLLGRRGQTIGKKVVGVRTVDEGRPEPIGVGRALLRLVVAWGIAFFPFGTFVDLLWPLWDDRKQTLHDKVVNSVTVYV